MDLDKHENVDMASISSSDDDSGIEDLVHKTRFCGAQLADAIALLHKQLSSARPSLLNDLAVAFPIVGNRIDSNRKVMGIISGLLRINVNTVRHAIANRRVSTRSGIAKRRQRAQQHNTQDDEFKTETNKSPQLSHLTRVSSCATKAETKIQTGDEVRTT